MDLSGLRASVGDRSDRDSGYTYRSYSPSRTEFRTDSVFNNSLRAPVGYRDAVSERISPSVHENTSKNTRTSRSNDYSVHHRIPTEDRESYASSIAGSIRVMVSALTFGLISHRAPSPEPSPTPQPATADTMVAWADLILPDPGHINVPDLPEPNPYAPTDESGNEIC